MTTAKPPTPQGISALLRKAGFKRSNAGQPGVMWNEASTGYRVYLSRHQNDLRRPYVVVRHVDFGQAHCSDNWERHVKEAPAHLEKYAEVIRARGYRPLLRAAGRDEPTLVLIVTAPAPGEGEQS